MSQNHPNIVQLFANKASQCGSDLGSPVGPVEFDNDKNRHFQRFEHGVIWGKFNNITSPSDLICSYGRLFDESANPAASWLGQAIEDPYESSDFHENELLVQRFEHGVIWCLKNGEGNACFLSWRDWHAISRPCDNESSIPSSPLLDVVRRGRKRTFLLWALTFLVGMAVGAIWNQNV